MKVYVITRGVYDSYEILTATVDKSKAEILVKMYQAEDGIEDPLEQARMEEWDTDVSDLLVEGYRYFFFAFNRNGKIVRQTFSAHRDESVHYSDFTKQLNVSLLEKDETAARKLAIERYNEWLAKQAGN